MTTIIDGPITRAEIETAIVGHNLTLKRMPAHWTDRRARIHGAIDNLLVEWEQAPLDAEAAADVA